LPAAKRRALPLGKEIKTKSEERKVKEVLLAQNN
jgi:hypothetical protein